MRALTQKRSFQASQMRISPTIEGTTEVAGNLRWINSIYKNSQSAENTKKKIKKIFCKWKSSISRFSSAKFYALPKLKIINERELSVGFCTKLRSTSGRRWKYCCWENEMQVSYMNVFHNWNWNIAWT